LRTDNTDAGRAYASPGITELGMVKEVKELRSELYSHPVLRSEEGVLDQSEVEV